MAIEYLDEVAPSHAQKKRGVEYLDAPALGSTIEYLDEVPTKNGSHGASGSWTPNTPAVSPGELYKVGTYPGTQPTGNNSIDTYQRGLDAFLNGDRETANKLASEAYRLDPKNIEARNLVERIQRSPMAGTKPQTAPGKPIYPQQSTLEGVVKGLPGLASDVTSQAAREVAASAGYMGAGAVSGATMGYVNPTPWLEKSPYLSGANISKRTAMTGGSLVGAIAPIAAISKGVGGAIKTAQVFNNVRPWLQSVFQAGVTGGIFGAARKPGENESRAQNAADDAGLFMAFTGAAHSIQRAFVKDVIIPDAKKAEVLQKATDAGIDAYAKGGSKSEAGRVFTETLDTEAKAARAAVKSGVPGTQDVQPQGYKEPATIVRTPTALSNAINRIIKRIRKPSVGLNRPIDTISSTEGKGSGIGQDVAPLDSGPTPDYPVGSQVGVPSLALPGGLDVSRGMVPGGPASPPISISTEQGGEAVPQITAPVQPAQGVVPSEPTRTEVSPLAPSPSGEVSPAEPPVTPTKKYKIPKADIKARAEALWHQAIEERGQATGLEQFIIENGGMKANSDTKEEFRSVPLHLRGNKPVDVMKQMAIDAGIANVPDDLTYWAGSLKKRGPVPKKYMFLDEAERELQHEYETYGPPKEEDNYPSPDIGGLANDIPFENKAPYGAQGQQDLFSSPTENVGQAFERLLNQGKKQGLTTVQAIAYAKKTLAAQERGTEGPQEGPRASQIEMGAPGGVDGFGRGQKGQGSLSLFEKKSPYSAGPGQLDLWRPTPEGQHQRPVDIPKAIKESVVVKELKETGFLDVHTTTITSPEDTAAIFSFMQNNNMESMYAIGMDGAGKMLGVQMVGMGNINQIPLSTRDTLAGMHAMGAAKVVFVHNHPSHDATPSVEDRKLTTTLAGLAKSVDIELLHHIVINDKTFGLIHPGGDVEMRPFAHPKPSVGQVRTVSPKQQWDPNEDRLLVNQPDIAARVVAGIQQNHPGVVILAMNTKNKINGIWHVASRLPVNPAELVAEAGKIAMRNAAASIIISTNLNPNSTYVKEVKRGLSPWGVELLDWVGFDGKVGPLFSARTSGVLGESKASYGITNSNYFKKWFGDSVVTDTGKPMSEGGKPLVVYHGSNQQFSTFASERAGQQTGSPTSGWGFFFTPSSGEAGRYAEFTGRGRHGANVIPVFLSLKNPKVITRAEFNAYGNLKGDPKTWGEQLKALTEQANTWKEQLVSNGHDGVIVEGKGFNTEYIAFDPTQIKSATGNAGTFDPNNPNILKESGGGYGGKPPVPPVSNPSDFGSGDAYEANRLLAKKGSFTHYKIGDILESSKNLAETILTPISTVLKNIDMSLKVALRHHAFTTLKNTHDDLHASMSFMVKTDKMPHNDQADLDLAGKNGDVEKLREILSKHGAWAEYDAYRRTMDSLRDRAIASGVDMGYLSDYFPRIVEDKAGFMEAVQADMRWPDISALIDQAEVGGILSDDDKIALINNYLRGYSQGVINIRAPGNVKTRTIAILSPQMNQFYMDWRPAAIRYIEGMNKMIGDRVFFGKSAKKVDEGKDMFGINKNKIDTEKSIGAFVKEAVESGRVHRLDERVLRETLDAYFNQKNPSLAIKIYRDMTTMQTIGNAIAALTQLQDLGFSFYRAPLQTIQKMFKSFINRSDIKLKDLGLDSIAEEFSTRTRLSRSVSTVLKLAGLTSLDRITSETPINAIVEKYRSQARRGMAGGLEERLRAAVGDKWQKVAEDLANGKTTTDIMELAFNEILDVQPKALTELPRGYLKGGNARIFYMLKTFQIRQIDYIRMEAFAKMSQPGLKNKAIGMGRLLSMIAVLGGMGVATDQLKDWVLGRKTKFDDRIIDNILKLAGLSKWTIYKARQEGLGSALMKTILPPAPIIDQLWKDVATAGDKKGLESVQSIPLVGKAYYWRFGRGREKTLAKHPELRTPDTRSHTRALRSRTASHPRAPLRKQRLVTR